jgi:hypothetical protein
VTSAGLLVSHTSHGVQQLRLPYQCQQVPHCVGSADGQTATLGDRRQYSHAHACRCVLPVLPHTQDLLVDSSKAATAGKAAAGAKGGAGGGGAGAVVLREARTGGVMVVGLEELQVRACLYQSCSPGCTGLLCEWPVQFIRLRAAPLACAHC